LADIEKFVLNTRDPQLTVNSVDLFRRVLIKRLVKNLNTLKSAKSAEVKEMGPIVKNAPKPKVQTIVKNAELVLYLTINPAQKELNNESAICAAVADLFI
jgi:hypothetical protein